MPSLRRTFWVLHAWVLAVLTPGIGLPHRQCTCPDGGVKWFCLRFAEGSCCCDSACCAPRPHTQGPPSPTRCCCCRHAGRRIEQPREPGRGLRETPCRKTWLPSSIISDRTPRDTDPAKLTPVPLPTATLAAEIGLIPEGVREPLRQVNHPPPLDRVILLERLLL